MDILNSLIELIIKLTGIHIVFTKAADYSGQWSLSTRTISISKRYNLDELESINTLLHECTHMTFCLPQLWHSKLKKDRDVIWDIARLSELNEEALACSYPHIIWGDDIRTALVKGKKYYAELHSAWVSSYDISTRPVQDYSQSHADWTRVSVYLGLFVGLDITQKIHTQLESSI